MSRNKEKKNTGEAFPPVLYGLQGICDLFGVKKTTAFRYKNGIIADAVTQKGRKIIIDTKKALELYGVKDTTNFLSSKTEEK